ncbi:RNase3 domain protein [Catonella morbi ATCC 51271]|uniref:Mini-ribonuclease 3 n=1 Tax=Catonella morbi ATCC 51271 TaxID=592026 RepID=V2XNX7_9FIRM|nr:ribonuclease III domain-containing protein [Catonella morbi]ESL03884.1 RNase3 domain protein [Catonella morbi ATCC 51271]
MEENVDIAGLSVSGIDSFFGIEGKDIRSFSPLTLAYIGDAVYEIVIRTIIVEKGNAPVNKLHHKASSLVKAVAQKAAMEKILPLLTEEEEAVYKRGRNAKSYTSAKNASVIDYRIATGFEALMGFLYLMGRNERMLELVKIAVNNLV